MMAIFPLPDTWRVFFYFFLKKNNNNRSLGLRHLAVVSEHNNVVGIITRKDLMGQTLEERLVVARAGMHKKPKSCWSSCFG